jgi:hypothetical protein
MVCWEPKDLITLDLLGGDCKIIKPLIMYSLYFSTFSSLESIIFSEFATETAWTSAAYCKLQLVQ